MGELNLDQIFNELRISSILFLGLITALIIRNRNCLHKNNSFVIYFILLMCFHLTFVDAFIIKEEIGDDQYFKKYNNSNNITYLNYNMTPYFGVDITKSNFDNETNIE